MLRRKLIVAAIVSASMIGSSTAAVAAAPAPAPASSAWMTLSALSPSGAAVLGSAAAAAQPAAVTCPDGAVVPAGAPCPAPAAYTGPGFPPIPVLIVLAAVLAVAIYVASKGRSHANSPF